MTFNPQPKPVPKVKRIRKFLATSTRVTAKLIKQADDKIREIVRRRDSDEDGFAVCFTCPNSAHFSQMEVGHFVPRGNYSVRWDLLNCHLQCRECNRDKRGNLEVYAERLDKKYGMGTADCLKRIAKGPYKLNRLDLEEKIKKQYYDTGR